jgi:glutamate synthase domain-containing protein 3
LAERVVSTRDINAAIHRQLEKSSIVKIGDTEKGGLTGQDCIAVGLMQDAEIIVTGDAGDYFGAFNHRPLITLNGTAGRFLGDSMSGGGLIVKGRVRHGVGVYMTGGIIVIKGSSEGEVGRFNLGGAVLVNGKTGEGSGSYMHSGTVIITGKAGKKTGEWLTGGELLLGQEPEGYGENTRTQPPDKKDIEKLQTYFDHYGILYDNLEDYIKVVPENPEPFQHTIKAGGGLR